MKRPIALIVCWFAWLPMCAWAVTGPHDAPQGTPDTNGQAHSKQPKWPWRPEQLALSPDGQWLAARVDTWRKWGAVWLLNLTNRKARVVTSGPAVALSEAGIGCLTFSPDSKFLALCGAAGEIGLGKSRSDYAVQLWDISTGKELPGFIRHGEAGYLVFSPDGRYIAAAPWNQTLISPPIPFLNYGFRTHNLLQLWDRRTGKPVKLRASYRNYLLGLAFSPDSTRLAVGTYRHISLLEIPKGKEIRRLECGSYCEAPVFSPDGKLIAAYSWHGMIYSNNGYVQLWDVSTGRKRDTSPALTGTGCPIAFAPATQVLATPQLDNTIPLWDVASGREVRRLTFPQGAPCLFVFTPDGKTLIGGGPEHSPVVHMWDANSGKDLQHWDLTPLLKRGAPRESK